MMTMTVMTTGHMRAKASGRVAHDAADARIHAARLFERPS